MPNVSLIAASLLMLIVGMAGGYEIAFIILQPQISNLQIDAEMLRSRITVLQAQLGYTNDKLNATRTKLIEAEDELANAEERIASLNTSLQALLEPTIIIFSYPSNVTAGRHIVVRWKVTGGTPGRINNTAVCWGNRAGTADLPLYGFPNVSPMFTGDSPQSFQVEITAPLTPGMFFFRAHAIVDGKDVWSDEKVIIIT